MDSDKVVWVDIGLINKNPNNTNKHPEKQIERLAKIINYQGFRNPLVIASKVGAEKTDILAAGEGRLLAAIQLGLSKVPVFYQEFQDWDQFNAYVTSDNAVALLAEIDFGMVNNLIGDFDPEFDLDLLGIENFKLDASEKEKEPKPKSKCPHCGESI